MIIVPEDRYESIPSIAKALHFCWTYYCIKANTDYCDVSVVCVPNYRNGIDQENCFLHKNAEKAGKRDRLFSRGWDEWVVEIHIRYDQVWTTLELLSTLEPLSGTFILRWVHLNMSELGGEIHFYESWVKNTPKLTGNTNWDTSARLVG